MRWEILPLEALLSLIQPVPHRMRYNKRQPPTPAEKKAKATRRKKNKAARKARKRRK